MKVLIISHNAINENNSIGKTLLTLFLKLNKNELCQIYINKKGVPKKGVCSSSVRINDMDVIKGIFTGNVKVDAADEDGLKIEDDEPDVNGVIYKNTCGSEKKHQPCREIARDFFWKLSPWFNKKLKEWLSKVKPTCIFVAIGSGKFLYDIAIKTRELLNIPIFTYVCDDFYSMKTPKAFLGRLWKKQLKSKTENLIKQSDAVVSICQELSEYYEEEFNIKAYTIMTGTSYDIRNDYAVKDKISALRYFGKLSLNRFRSIADIGQAVDEINVNTDNDYSVEIYTGDNITDDIKETLMGIKSIKLCGFLQGEKFKNKLLSSDALIHVEAFDDESVSRVKHSVSTKIADSLASGIPLLAYGPGEVASIRHLIRNNCAFVATDKKELYAVLVKLFTDKAEREYVCGNAVIAADKYHNPNKVSEKLYSILSGNN